MAEYTTHFNLIKIGPGQTIADDDYKALTTDRDTIDQLMLLGASTHHHTGAAAAESSIDVGNRTLALEHFDDAGNIPAGVRAYYLFTLVVDGLESAVSDVFFIDTPPPVASPGAPTLVVATTGGTLLPGNYYYMLTAYTGANTDETRGLNPAFKNIPSGTSTNQVTLTLPALPDGATGFNIYRKKPGGVRYDYLTSIDMGATPATEFVDTGAIEEDCDRTLPLANYTSRMNRVEVTIEGDAVESGDLWRLYRSYTPDSFLNSRIAELPSTTTMFNDLGATGTASPPSSSVAVPSPEKIDLQDAAEVQGQLPQGMVSAFPCVVTFHFPGIQEEGPGEGAWPCPFDNARVVQAAAALGRDSLAAATDLITDIVIGRGTTPVYTSVYAAEASMPTILAGTNKTDVSAAADGTLANRRMVAGDVLSADIIQTGGGATPTDEDLTVSVLLYVESGDPGISEVWP